VVAAAAARPVDVAGPAHRALAREVAARSMVLLRNEAVPAGTGTVAPGPATPVLPLPAGARVAVVGRLAGVANLGDRGSSAVRPPEVVTPQQGLAARFALVEDPAAADAAIVVVGFTHREEGEYIGASTPADLLALLPPAPERPERPERSEPAAAPAAEETLALGIGGDRERLTLSDDDEALILATVATNPRTVVVLEGGSAVLCERWRQRVPAIVMAWYPGMEGGHALADVLTGDVNPGAKLPFAVPTDEAHLPPFDRNAMTIEYGPLHGYRLFHAEGHEAAFPFGFGLSYTRFVLGPSTLVEDAAGVTVTTTVTNVGACDGEEVVQVYATAEGWPAPRLVGFRRAAIPTGAALDVSVRVAATEFATWDPALGLRTVTGPYRLAAGNHAGALEVVGEAWAGRPEIRIGRLQTEVGHP
jgi:beta-glucosidase